jgi:hypothetical protein
MTTVGIQDDSECYVVVSDYSHQHFFEYAVFG